MITTRKAQEPKLLVSIILGVVIITTLTLFFLASSRAVRENPLAFAKQLQEWWDQHISGEEEQLKEEQTKEFTETYHYLNQAYRACFNSPHTDCICSLGSGEPPVFGKEFFIQLQQHPSIKRIELFPYQTVEEKNNVLAENPQNVPGTLCIFDRYMPFGGIQNGKPIISFPSSLILTMNPASNNLYLKQENLDIYRFLYKLPNPSGGDHICFYHLGNWPKDKSFTNCNEAGGNTCFITEISWTTDKQTFLKPDDKGIIHLNSANKNFFFTLRGRGCDSRQAIISFNTAEEIVDSKKTLSISQQTYKPTFVNGIASFSYKLPDFTPEHLKQSGTPQLRIGTHIDIQPAPYISLTDVPPVLLLTPSS